MSKVINSLEEKYVLYKLSNGDYYSGSSQDLKERVKDHQEGKNISTKPFRPVKLAFYCTFPTKTQAIELEIYLKSGSGKAFRNRHLIKNW